MAVCCVSACCVAQKNTSACFLGSGGACVSLVVVCVYMRGGFVVWVGGRAVRGCGGMDRFWRFVLRGGTNCFFHAHFAAFSS